MTAPLVSLPPVEPGCLVCGQAAGWQVGDERTCQAHIGDVLAVVFASGPVFAPPLVLPLEAVDR